MMGAQSDEGNTLICRTGDLNNLKVPTLELTQF